ncbi:hypothetical protein J6590_054824 [Homalodisca vitripennis]|nr:hypothetical protein J6590_054824 [Homalodisca vitripennis]
MRELHRLRNIFPSPKELKYCPHSIASDKSAYHTDTLAKFLGISLGRGLTWNDHIDQVCAKLSTGISVFRSLDKYCPIQVLMAAYYGLITPSLPTKWRCEAEVHFTNKQPNGIKKPAKTNVLNTRLKRFLTTQAFYVLILPSSWHLTGRSLNQDIEYDAVDRKLANG